MKKTVVLFCSCLLFILSGCNSKVTTKEEGFARIATPTASVAPVKSPTFLSTTTPTHLPDITSTPKIPVSVQPEATEEPSFEEEPDTYRNGTFQGGHTIPTGEYVIFSDRGHATYELFKSVNRHSKKIICTETVTTNTILTIYKGETLTIADGYALPIKYAPVLDTTCEGMFKIGLHLAAGTYTVAVDAATPPKTGYCAITTSSSHLGSSVNKELTFSNPITVTVTDGQYLILKGAHLVL